MIDPKSIFLTIHGINVIQEEKAQCDICNAIEKWSRRHSAIAHREGISLAKQFAMPSNDADAEKRFVTVFWGKAAIRVTCAALKAD